MKMKNVMFKFVGNTTDIFIITVHFLSQSVYFVNKSSPSWRQNASSRFSVCIDIKLIIFLRDQQQMYVSLLLSRTSIEPTKFATLKMCNVLNS